MNKTPKAYRDDLSKDLWTKRKEANEKIKRIQENSDFLEAHKEEAIKIVKDNLYKELDDTIATKEYQGAKSKKQALRGKKKEVKKQKEVVTEQEKILGEKEDELNIITEEYGEKSESKESKETVTKSLEFEKDTFKISSEWWEEATEESAKKNPALKKFIDKGIRVKVNTTWDVVEYMEDRVNWTLKCKKWEQIFITYDVFIKEVCKAKNCSKEEAEKKYLMTVDELKEKMEDKPNGSEEYKKFFNEEANGHLAGYWSPLNKGFDDLGERSSVWLVGGNGAGFDQSKWNWDRNDRDFGFGGRLLKN